MQQLLSIELNLSWNPEYSFKCYTCKDGLRSRSAKEQALFSGLIQSVDVPCCVCKDLSVSCYSYLSA